MIHPSSPLSLSLSLSLALSHTHTHTYSCPPIHRPPPSTPHRPLSPSSRRRQRSSPSSEAPAASSSSTPLLSVFAKDFLMPTFHGLAVFSYVARKRGSADSKPPPPPQAELYHLEPLLAPHDSMSRRSRSDRRAGYDVIAPPSLQQQQPREPSPKSTPTRISKKVRFADETVLIPACSRGDGLDRCSSTFHGERLPNERSPTAAQISATILNDDARRSRNTAADDRATSMDMAKQGNRTGAGTAINGIVRLKVMISKKDLTELMSPKTTRKQVGDMVERIIAPLLSPQSSTIPPCC